MSNFVRHTALNAVAFATAAALQLALVPVVVRAYGFAGLGELALARLLMPTALLGVCLSGLPTLAVRRAAMNTEQDRRVNGAGVIVAGAIGTTLSVFLAAPQSAAIVMRLAGRPEASALVGEMRPILAGSQLILFPGLVLQSILQGMERYAVLRITELCATLGVLVAALVGAHYDWPVQFVLYALFLLQVSKCLLQAVIAFLYGSRFAMRTPRLRDFSVLGRDIVIYGPNNVIGALVTQLPAVLISGLAGPTALGQFEAARRIPQALKLLIGLINSAVLPRASVLAVVEGRHRLGQFAMRVSQISALVTLGVFIPLMGMSYSVVAVWLGPQYTDLSPLLVLMLMEGALAVSPATIDAAAAAHPRAVTRQTALRTLEGGLILFASLSLTLPFGLAIFLSVNVIIAAFGLLARRLFVTPLLGISPQAWTVMIIRRGLPLVAATLLVAVLQAYMPLSPFVSLVLGLLLIWFVAALSYKAILPQQEQLLLLRVLSEGLRKRS
jgi:O-antigen/teichoic acid export membrane protein